MQNAGKVAPCVSVSASSYIHHVSTSVFYRRMFPHCKVNLSGLIPCAKYILLVDMVPEDGFRYKVRLKFTYLSFIYESIVKLSISIYCTSVRPGEEPLTCESL